MIWRGPKIGRSTIYPKGVGEEITQVIILKREPHSKIKFETQFVRAVYVGCIGRTPHAHSLFLHGVHRGAIFARNAVALEILL